MVTATKVPFDASCFAFNSEVFLQPLMSQFHDNDGIDYSTSQSPCRVGSSISA